MKDAFMNAWNWTATNWVPVALVLSEIAAFVPVKAKGLIHGFLKLGQAIFSSNKQSFKSRKK